MEETAGSLLEKKGNIYGQQDEALWFNTGPVFKNNPKQGGNPPSFAQCKGSYDSLSLLKILREFIFWSDNRQYKYKAEDQAKHAYYNLRQTPEMSCQEYFERVRNVVDVIKSLGGSLVDEVHLLDELPPWPAAGYTQIQIDQCMVYWFEWTGIDTESLSRKLKILTLKVAVITQVLQQKPTIYRSITKTITLEKGP